MDAMASFGKEEQERWKEEGGDRCEKFWIREEKEEGGEKTEFGEVKS